MNASKSCFFVNTNKAKITLASLLKRRKGGTNTEDLEMKNGKQQQMARKFFLKIIQYSLNFSANNFDNLGERNDFLRTNESPKIDIRITITRQYPWKKQRKLPEISLGKTPDPGGFHT